MLPPVVSTASPTSTGPWRIASSSTMTPPLRLMAPATPVPIASVVLAALTTASTSRSVMSPRSIAMVAGPILSFMSGLLPVFGGIPRALELLGRHGLDRLAALAQLVLHFGEPAVKLCDGAAERFLGIEIRQARDVDHGEEQVPELLGQVRPIGLGHDRRHFANLLVHF